MRTSTLFTAGAIVAQALLGAASKCRPSPASSSSVVSSVASSVASSSSSAPFSSSANLAASSSSAPVSSSSAAPVCTNPTFLTNVPLACTEGVYYTYSTASVYYNELCQISVNVGSAATVISPGTGLSLRACMSSCAVRSATCKFTAWDSATNVCYLFADGLAYDPSTPGVFNLAISHDKCP